MVSVHADAETHAQHALFARCQRGEHAGCGLAQVRLDRRVNRQDGVLVFDEVAKMAVFFIANRRFQRDRFFGDLHHLADFFERHGKFFRQLFRCRLAANFVQHLARSTHDLIDRLDHMHRNTDGARLIGD